MKYYMNCPHCGEEIHTTLLNWCPIELKEVPISDCMKCKEKGCCKNPKWKGK